jgi:hypothetical protein
MASLLLPVFAAGTDGDSDGDGGVGVGVGVIAAAVTVTVYARESVPVAFVAVTVNVNDPDVVGVPEMAPVVGSRVSPAGRAEPLARAKVIGPVPVAVMVWE